MIDEEQPIEKSYFSIGEVAAMFELNISNVRYWENEFDILKPKKNAKGDRFFSRKDVENIRIIKELIKGRGYTLEGAKIKLKESRDTLHERMKMLESLENVKLFLTTMKTQLENPVTETATNETVVNASSEPRFEEVSIAENNSITENVSVNNLETMVVADEPILFESEINSTEETGVEIVSHSSTYQFNENESANNLETSESESSTPQQAVISFFTTENPPY